MCVQNELYIPSLSELEAHTKRRSGRVIRPLLSNVWPRSGHAEQLEDLGEGFVDGEALLVLLYVLLALLVRHLVERYLRARERDALHVFQLPHLVVLEEDVRLRDQGLAVGADVAEVLDDVGQIPVVVQGLPLAQADQSAHGGRRAAVVLLPEGHLVGPVTGIGAVGPPLVVDVVEDRVLADQARNHARPAAVRILVAGVFEGYRVVAVGLGQRTVVLPPLAELVVPAGVLVLEPLKVFLDHWIDAPVVDRPAGGEELGYVVYVVLVVDSVPRLLDQIVRDLQAVLLERGQIATIVVVVDPPPVHLRVAFAVFTTVLGAVVDKRSDRRVHDRVVVPPGVAQVALEQILVLVIAHRHNQRGVAVADMPRLVGLGREEYGGQQEVAVGRGLGRHRHEQNVREGGLGHGLQVDVARRDRVASDERLAELAADGTRVVVVEGLLGNVEPGGVDVVLHVLALQVHLERRVTNLVDHLNREPVVELRIGHRFGQERHGPRGRDLGERDDAQEELLPLHPPGLHLTEHVPANRPVNGAVDPLVLLLLHREVGLQDLLHRFLRLSVRERVVGLVPRVLLDVRRLPGHLLYLVVSFGKPLFRHELYLPLSISSLFFQPT